MRSARPATANTPAQSALQSASQSTAQNPKKNELSAHLKHIPREVLRVLPSGLLTQKPNSGNVTLSNEECRVAFRVMDSCFCKPGHYENKDTPFEKYYGTDEKPTWEGKNWENHFVNYCRAYNQLFCLVTGRNEEPLNYEGWIAHTKTEKFIRSMKGSSGPLGRDDEMVSFAEVDPIGNEGVVNIAQNAIAPRFGYMDWIVRIKGAQKTYIGIFEDINSFDETGDQMYTEIIGGDNDGFGFFNQVILDKEQLDFLKALVFRQENQTKEAAVNAALEVQKEMMKRDPEAARRMKPEDAEPPPNAGMKMSMFSYYLTRMLLDIRIMLSRGEDANGRTGFHELSDAHIDKLGEKLVSKLLVDAPKRQEEDTNRLISEIEKRFEASLEKFKLAFKEDFGKQMRKSENAISERLFRDLTGSGGR